MKAISGLTSMFDSLTKVVVSLLALGIAVSLLGGNVPFVGEIAGRRLMTLYKKLRKSLLKMVSYLIKLSSN